MKYTALVLLITSWSAFAAAEKVVFHQDRPTPQVVSQPDQQPSGLFKRAEVARQYLEDNWQRYGLEPNAANLEQYRVQQSLLGTHFHFRQTIGGIPLAFADIIVSVEKNSNKIFKVYNSTWPNALRHTEKKLPVLLQADDALHVSWNHMRVSGPLTSVPSMDLMYFRIKDRFVLVYQVNLNLEDPAGSWSILVDAGTGKVHAVDQIDRHKHRSNVDFSERRAVVANLESELAIVLQKRETLDQRKLETNKRAAGTTRTFDPDPATTLRDPNIDDFSPNADFEDAYYMRPLEDITLDPDDTYRLVGPWCQIIDFETPSTTPATVNGNAGFFDFVRGDNGFYDAMTYFHIDKNQRYMQDLGFTGSMSIQGTSIEVDANGLNGADNSHYISNVSSLGVNRLSFGHGGVPDNEDADVILHEYGHAIQKWINNAWYFSADEGAMGEGFADYWGAVYSLASPSGPLYHPEWIYSWDGHNGYWDGRWMDRLDFIYESNRNYEAHEFFFSTGYISDELWATPLFQAALELYNTGIPLEETNRIILQSHFGMGSGVTMPVLAQSTVDSAMMLYPDGPHAQVFRNAFARQGILTAQDSYTYYTAHVPPGTAEWVNEIHLVNPNEEDATITTTVYEGDVSGIGLADYTAHDPVVQNLAGGSSLTFVPAGERQRWVRIDSDLPLAGTAFLNRIRENEGEERAGIPLFANPEVSNTMILPHIPADRNKFFSSAVILNPNDTPVDLTIELFGIQGSNLTNLLSEDAPTQLDANQKWVGFLTPFGGQGLFDDAGNGELVSWVKITGSGDLAAFQLYGYVNNGNNLSSSGIKALSNTSASPSPIDVTRTWAIRTSRTSSDFTGFSVLNPATETANLHVSLLYTDGTHSAEEMVSIGPGLKTLGLNNNGAFSFPYPAGTVFDEANGDDIQAMMISSDQDLRIFELVGHDDNSTLDGAAVNPLTSHTVFANARGVLEILRVGYPGETSEDVDHPGNQPFNARTLTVTIKEPGQAEVTTTHTMKPGEAIRQAIPGTGDTTVIVEGTRFTASVIDYNQTDRSLTIVNGQQVEFHPDGQN